jgi:hypothetical protein
VLGPPHPAFEPKKKTPPPSINVVDPKRPAAATPRRGRGFRTPRLWLYDTVAIGHCGYGTLWLYSCWLRTDSTSSQRKGMWLAFPQSRHDGFMQLGLRQLSTRSFASGIITAKLQNGHSTCRRHARHDMCRACKITNSSQFKSSRENDKHGSATHAALTH